MLCVLNVLSLQMLALECEDYFWTCCQGSAKLLLETCGRISPLFSSLLNVEIVLGPASQVWGYFRKTTLSLLTLMTTEVMHRLGK